MHCNLKVQHFQKNLLWKGSEIVPYIKKETKENIQTTGIWITRTSALEKIQRQLCSPVWARNAQDLVSTCVRGRWLQETMEMCGKPNRDKSKKKMDLPVNQASYSCCSQVTDWSSGNWVILRHCHSCYYSQTDERFQPEGILGNTSDSGFEFVSMALMDTVVEL